MHKKAGARGPYYFSQSLTSQLVKIPAYPVTVMEAPCGFGKTTAVREYFKSFPEGTRRHWYTCLGEPASIAWAGICWLFSQVDEDAAEKLTKLQMPTMNTMIYVAPILQNLRCTQETYLVIDNYHLVGCLIPRELISIFSLHGHPKLHIVFITRQLGAVRQHAMHNDNIHLFDPTAFAFDREGIAALFLYEGIRLNAKEADKVYEDTHGWVSAVRLKRIQYERTGSLDLGDGLDDLVEVAVWDQLAPEEKDFLLSVSVLGSFTSLQAAIMAGMECLPDKLQELLRHNDFIRYSSSTSLYVMHNILREYLQNRFCNRPKAFQNEMFRRAGQACATAGQHCRAAQFFLKIGEFEAILSMPFHVDHLCEERGENLRAFITALIGECPEETLCKYPFAILTFAYPMVFDRQFKIAHKLCRLIHRAIEKNGAGLDREGLRRLQGELIHLTAFMEYNDIRKMNESSRLALEILGGPSAIMLSDVPWTFGDISILNMFWRESGKLAEALCNLEECLPCYLQLTRGHGAGADSLMLAEAMLMQGKDHKAEALCYRALNEARVCRQTVICLCAQLVLANIAILRGDVKGYFAAARDIRDCAQHDPRPFIKQMVELCLTVLSLVLGMKDHIPQWLYQMQSIQEAMYLPSVPFIQMLHSKLLLLDRRYGELYGISQLTMDAARGAHQMLPQVGQLILLAAAKHENGNDQGAREYLIDALNMALPDKIYIPFAVHWSQLSPLFTSSADILACLKTKRISRGEIYTALPETLFDARRITLPQELGDELAALIAVCKRQEKGAMAIKKAVLRAKSPLTPREREIASLAREGISNREIAETLYISEKTVKTILHNAFVKLDIHTKAELNKIEILTI